MSLGDLNPVVVVSGTGQLISSISITEKGPAEFNKAAKGSSGSGFQFSTSSGAGKAVINLEKTFLDHKIPPDPRR